METDQKLEVWDRADREQDTTQKAVVRESQGTMVEEAITRIARMVVGTISTIVMMANRNRDLEETGTKVEATIEIDRKEATQSHLTVEATKIEVTEEIDKVATIKEATEVAVDSQRSQTHLS